MALGKKLKLFTGTANPPLAKAIADYCTFGVGKVEIKEFSDGEILAEYGENIRGHHVVIVQPTNSLRAWAELFQLAYAAVSNSASFVTAVIPYFGNSRADRKDKRRVGITARLMADKLITAGVQKVVLLDPHFEQLEGYFDPRFCQTEMLRARPVFVSLFRELGLTDVVNGPPDLGRGKIVEAYFNRLGGGVFFAYKIKVDGKAEKVLIMGDVDGKVARIIDDESSTGGTLIEASTALHDAGATAVDLVVSHGKFIGDASAKVAALPWIRKVYIGDSVLLRDEVKAAFDDRLVQVTFAPLLGQAILNIHDEQSLYELEDEDVVAKLYRGSFLATS